MSMAHISRMEEIAKILKNNKAELNEKNANELEIKGYTVFPALFSMEQLAPIRDKFEKLMYKQGYHIGRNMVNNEECIADIILMQFQTEQHHSSETINEVRNLVNDDEIFDQLYTYPELLAGVFHLMNMDFKLSELTARETLPGGGIEHAYRLTQSKDSLEQVGVQAIWLLDDFTENNGGISFFQGSHHSDNHVLTENNEAAAIPIYAPAGSLILTDTRLLRIDRVNRSEQNNRIIYANFMARNQTQALLQKDFIRLSTYNRISELAKFILDV